MSDPRRASEDLLAQLIREGRQDAEIGVRLGISTGQVRERKAALRGRLGEEKYHQLLGGARPKRFSKKRIRIVATAALVVLVLAGLLAVANLLDPGEEEIAAVRTVPTATAIPTARPPAVITVGSERFEDAGPFLALGEASTLPFIGSTENRAALSVVSLLDKAFIFQSDFARWTIAGGGRGTLRLRAPQLGGRAVTLVLTAGDQTTRIRSLATGVGPVAEVSTQFDSMPPVLLVRAYDDAGRQLRTQVTAEGRLSISREPIPADWVVERTTGSRLDVTQSVDFGRIATGDDVGVSTFCGLPSESLRCGVTWVRSKGWDTPVEGVFSCPGPTSLRFEGGGLRLDFSRGFSLGTQGNFRCDPETFPAGSRIIPEGDWEVVAATIEGEPLSVGVGNTGNVVVGRFSGEYKCPCLAQQ